MWLAYIARVKRVAESQNRFYTGDVSDEDMAEAPRRYKDSATGTLLRAVMVVIALLALTVLLIRGTRPAMTPEQIVQQQSYQGEQSARKIFNLYSLKQERARREVARIEMDVQATSQATSSESVDAAEKQLAARLHNNKETVSDSTSGTYEKAQLTREVPTQLISKIIAQPEVPARSVGPTRPNGTPRILPLFTLKNASAVLRESPSFSAGQIAVIRPAQTVTLFETTGDWAQVAANDGSGRTGYVLRADLVPAEE